MTHVHHWRIDTPNGPVSEGRCRCGTRRTFRNSYDALAAHAHGHAPINEQKIAARGVRPKVACERCGKTCAAGPYIRKHLESCA